VNFTIDLDLVVRIAYEANRIYCAALGKCPQPYWERAVRESITYYGDKVDAIAKDKGPTLEEAHNNWVSDKVRDGWKYGKEISVKNKTHPYMVEYKNLPPAVRGRDELFVAIVKVLLGQ